MTAIVLGAPVVAQDLSSITAPVVVNSDAATDGDEVDSRPSLATDGLGLLVAVWMNVENDNEDIFFACSTDQGATWSDQRVLWEPPGADVFLDEDPRIASDGSTWITSWHSSSNSVPGSSGIYLSRSTDPCAEVLSWSSPAFVTSPKPEGQQN